LITDGKQQNNEQFTYCPECGELREITKSEDKNSTTQCVMCFRNCRPRF
jgi:hypothetical protein